MNAKISIVILLILSGLLLLSCSDKTGDPVRPDVGEQDAIDIFFYEGNAILYKSSLEKVSLDSLVYDFKIPIKYLDDTIHISRGAIHLKLKSTEGYALNVINTHLETPYFFAKEQIPDLLDYIGSNIAPAESTVLLGDFNDEPDGEVIRQVLDAGFYDTYDSLNTGSGYTYGYSIIDITQSLTNTLDYIFAKNISETAESRVGFAGIVNIGDSLEYRISDHAAVITEFTSPALTFATFNMAVGFPVIDLVFQDLRDSAKVITTGKSLYKQFQNSMPRHRVLALADSICRLSPDVIGLQEVLYMNNNYDSLEYDYLAELMDAIDSLGGPSYAVVKQVMNPIHLDVSLVTD
jgi:endonuclease/exonuclease/phosphatase family metal-dependent hydrolase